MIWDEATYKRYESTVTRYQRQNDKSARDGKEARLVAVQRLIREEGLSMTVKEFESVLASCRSAYRKRTPDQQLVLNTDGETFAEKRNNYAKDVSNVELYYTWCMTNNDIPADYVLSHFTGYSRQSFHYARKKCTERGIVFSKSESGGYVVTARPQPKVETKMEKTFTEAEVRQMMEELVQKFGK